MKFEGINAVEVSLTATLHDMKQISAFIAEHLSEEKSATNVYNYYTIKRIKRELDDAQNRVKEDLPNL